MDKIILSGMQFYGYHGLFPEENKLGQRFQVNVELYTNLKKAGESDNMEDSIHYGHVYDIIRKIVEGEVKNLLEAVAEHIAKDLLASFELLQACRVNVVKLDPPIPGHFGPVAVEIYREKL
ncbi:dihydroneopterin aldolase [Virgibacillus soli]|uniref:7,8-dihydroneopterin aldolase n=1 Tax=Paracerasibacillus soli TaxID=480284 RepID=A0ABU5CX52_9BACI|nr:dihydroneopterin aldolase [Virgibacillus soli]MDY0410020.1 dihydroneopterin aldolase [Virgibacillus soli]